MIIYEWNGCGDSHYEATPKKAFLLKTPTKKLSETNCKLSRFIFVFYSSTSAQSPPRSFSSSGDADFFVSEKSVVFWSLSLQCFPIYKKKIKKKKKNYPGIFSTERSSRNKSSNRHSYNM